MSHQLDLTKFTTVSQSVPDRTPEDVFFHLVEELGEVAVCINRPHKAEEPLVGELADVFNCISDISMRAFGRTPLIPSTDERQFTHYHYTSKKLLLILTNIVGDMAGIIPGTPDECLDELLELAVTITLLIYAEEYGTDLSLFQEHLDKKCDKWAKVAGVTL